jgi:hypothetical protein
MPLLARTELGSIIGLASFCNIRVQASGIRDKGKPRICWRIIMEEE